MFNCHIILILSFLGLLVIIEIIFLICIFLNENKKKKVSDISNFYKKQNSKRKDRVDLHLQNVFSKNFAIALPNFFQIDLSTYLFFDIFYKDNDIYVIMPICDIAANTNQIVFSINKKPLIIAKKTQKLKYDPIEILVYKTDVYQSPPATDAIEVDVAFRDQKISYTLDHIDTNPLYMLTISTLFKDDYALFPIFYDYYKTQGVEHFYMYYNGKISPQIQSIFSRHDDVTLIEWDFPYWSHNSRPLWTNAQKCKFKHYAQLGQMHHAIYRYGKPHGQYMICCDLDEYLSTEDNSIVETIKNYPHVDVFGFCNQWSQTLDGEIPHTFPSNFLIDIFPHSYGTRSKNIYKMTSVKTISIHKYDSFENGIRPNILQNETELKMFHFFSWSKPSRHISTKNFKKKMSKPKINFEEKELRDISPFLQKYKNRRIIYIPNPGNAGDGLITHGTITLFDQLGMNYEIGNIGTRYDKKLLFYGGGGNLVGIYSNCRRFLENNIKENEIVILPHTVHNVDAILNKIRNANITIICREKKSYEYVSKFTEKVYLSKDMAFYLKSPSKRIGNGTINCFREDREKTNIVTPKNNVDLSIKLNRRDPTLSLKEDVKNITNRVFSYLNKYEIINTNRLHMAIAGSIIGKNVHLHPNNYYKNEKVWEYSMKDFFSKTKFIF